jgi:CBF/Mak21 family
VCLSPCLLVCVHVFGCISRVCVCLSCVVASLLTCFTSGSSPIGSLASSVARQLLKKQEETVSAEGEAVAQDDSSSSNDDEEKDEEEQEKKNAKSAPAAARSTQRDPDEEDPQNDYDPSKRQPEYAHARKSWIWELNLLANHVHPTVSKVLCQLLLVSWLSWLLLFQFVLVVRFVPMHC